MWCPSRAAESENVAGVQTFVPLPVRCPIPSMFSRVAIDAKTTYFLPFPKGIMSEPRTMEPRPKSTSGARRYSLFPMGFDR